MGETANSKITDIRWSTSRLGIVTPVAMIEPVFLSGATISQISLHNASYLQIFNIAAGDEITLIRSGEVIPKFLSIYKKGPNKAELPGQCSSCEASFTQMKQDFYAETRNVQAKYQELF